MMRVRAYVIVAVLVTAGASLAARQVRGRDCDWVAPAEAASKVNPLASQPAAEAGGRKLFEQRCAVCHGSDGRGTMKAPDLTRPEVQAQSDGTLFWKIGRGNARQGMPTFSYMPEGQRWQLVLHLRSLADGSASPLRGTLRYFGGVLRYFGGGRTALRPGPP